MLTRLMMCMFVVAICGCGAKQPKLLSLLEPPPGRPTKPSVYVSVADYTETMRKWDLPGMADRIAAKLSTPQVEIRSYYGTASHEYTADFFANPFTPAADSSSADVVALVRLSMADYVNRKEVEGFMEKVGRAAAWGSWAQFAPEQKVGFVMGDCEVHSRSGTLLMEYSISGRSLQANQSPRKSVDDAMDRTVEDFVRSFLSAK